jgi:hypothetical protein
LFALGHVDDPLIVNGRNLFVYEIGNLLSCLYGLTPGRALACAEFEPRTGATRLLILGEPSSDAVDIKALEAEIRILVLAETGIFPGTVRFLLRGFLLKSSSGKIARAENIRKYREWIGRVTL